MPECVTTPSPLLPPESLTLSSWCQRGFEHGGGGISNIFIGWITGKNTGWIIYFYENPMKEKTTGKKLIISYTQTLTNSEYDLKPL